MTTFPPKHDLDPSNLAAMIWECPDQYAVGMELAASIRLEGAFAGLAVAGMGGSALPTDLFRDFLEIQNRERGTVAPEVIVARDYTLPTRVDFPILTIFASYSGNTEETLSAFQDGLARGLRMVAISHGGKLEEAAKLAGVPHITVPSPYPGFQPRMATGYFIGIMAKLLETHGLATGLCDALLVAAAEMKANREALWNTGSDLAKKIAGTTPVVLSTERYRGMAMVWKIKINEHGKTPAYHNVFPEMNHNEMVGYTLTQGKFTAILLIDGAEHPRNLLRFQITQKLLESKGLQVLPLHLSGSTAFSRVMQSLFTGDVVAYSLALGYGIDPNPVAMVEDLKGELAKFA